MANHDSKEGMVGGKSADSDSIARAAKSMLNKGAKVHSEDKVTTNDPPRGNPDHKEYKESRRIPGSS